MKAGIRDGKGDQFSNSLVIVPLEESEQICEHLSRWQSGDTMIPERKPWFYYPYRTSMYRIYIYIHLHLVDFFLFNCRYLYKHISPMDAAMGDLNPVQISWKNFFNRLRRNFPKYGTAIHWVWMSFQNLWGARQRPKPLTGAAWQRSFEATARPPGCPGSKLMHHRHPTVDVGHPEIAHDSCLCFLKNPLQGAAFCKGFFALVHFDGKTRWWSMNIFDDFTVHLFVTLSLYPTSLAVSHDRTKKNNSWDSWLSNFTGFPVARRLVS